MALSVYCAGKVFLLWQQLPQARITRGEMWLIPVPSYSPFPLPAASCASKNAVSAIKTIYMKSTVTLVTNCTSLRSSARRTLSVELASGTMSPTAILGLGRFVEHLLFTVVPKTTMKPLLLNKQTPFFFFVTFPFSALTLVHFVASRN